MFKGDHLGVSQYRIPPNKLVLFVLGSLDPPTKRGTLKARLSKLESVHFPAWQRCPFVLQGLAAGTDVAGREDLKEQGVSPEQNPQTPRGTT